MTSGRTVATPRARPAALRTASTIARLSAPWHVACTITLRLTPRWSRRAKSWSLPASHGVYLRSGANGNASPGPNTWQCASTVPAGRANAGTEGSGSQSSHPGDVVKVELIAASGGWVLRSTLGENNPVHKMFARIVNNSGDEEA